MLKTISAIAVAVGLSAGAAALVVNSAAPSTVQLDRDLEAVRGEIAKTQSEIARYSSGLLLFETELRLQTLENTETMLEQKRLSFLRGLNLSYKETTPRIQADADIAHFREDVAKANADVANAEAEAARYSGGMIQSMALFRAAIGRVSVALVEQQIMLSRYGIPLPALGITDKQPSPVPSPGTVTSDKDALQ